MSRSSFQDIISISRLRDLNIVNDISIKKLCEVLLVLILLYLASVCLGAIVFFCTCLLAITQKVHLDLTKLCGDLGQSYFCYLLLHSL